MLPSRVHVFCLLEGKFFCRLPDELFASILFILGVVEAKPSYLWLINRLSTSAKSASNCTKCRKCVNVCFSTVRWHFSPISMDFSSGENISSEWQNDDMVIHGSAINAKRLTDRIFLLTEQIKNVQAWAMSLFWCYIILTLQLSVTSWDSVNIWKTKWKIAACHFFGQICAFYFELVLHRWLVDTICLFSIT